MMIDKRLIAAVPESRKWVALTVLLRILGLVSNTVLIFSAAEILKTKGENLFFPLIFIIASLLLNCASGFFGSVTSFKSSCSVKKTLRSRVYTKLLQLGPEYQEKTETAKIIQLAVEGVEQLEVWFGAYLPQFFYSMIAAVLTFAVLAFLNLKMALILLVCVPLIPMSIVCVQKIAKRLLSKYWGQYANLADNYLENLQGLTTLQIFEADDFKQKQMKLEAEHFRKVTMKVLSMQLNSIIIMDMVAYGGAGLGIAAAVSACAAGNLSVENCFICILLSADFFIPLRRLGSYFHTAMNGATASRNIFELLDQNQRKDGELPVAEKNESNNGIIFEADRLSYFYGQRKVLSDASISLKKGSFTSFTGKSGSGKSTLAKILAGINKDYSGSIKLNGTEIRDIKPEELYKYVSYISHRDWIFAGTVKECLLDGNPDADENQMWDALKKVRLDSFFNEQNGLETEIKENASNLSGGQKQRLSIARSLLKESQVYIFDEATSNIDVESEEAILELLKNLKETKTIVIISHRIENSLNADKIYEFSSGNCVLKSEVKNENAF